MRIERIIDQLAAELATKAGADWDKLDEEDRDYYRVEVAKLMAKKVEERLNDKGYKVPE